MTGAIAASSAASSAAAAQQAAIAQAIKASGSLVRVEPEVFMNIIVGVEMPLVVFSQVTGLFIRKHYQYLTPYRGLVFNCKSDTALQLPADTELIKADRIWIPG